MKEYMNLYEAIWTKALEDDTRKYKFKLYSDVAEKYFPEITKHNPRSESDIHTIIQDEYGSGAMVGWLNIEKYIENSYPKLIRLIKEKILREAEKWPYNTKRKDREFEKALILLKYEIINKIACERVMA